MPQSRLQIKLRYTCWRNPPNQPSIAYQSPPTLFFLSLPTPPFMMIAVIPASLTNCIDVSSLVWRHCNGKVDICTHITVSCNCQFVRWGTRYQSLWALQSCSTGEEQVDDLFRCTNQWDRELVFFWTGTIGRGSLGVLGTGAKRVSDDFAIPKTLNHQLLIIYIKARLSPMNNGSPNIT